MEFIYAYRGQNEQPSIVEDLLELTKHHSEAVGACIIMLQDLYQKMKKSAKSWQKQLGLEEPPSAELIALLEASSDTAPKSTGKPSGKYRFAEAKESIEQTLGTALLGQLLSQARQERSLTMQAVGDKLGISRGRVSQIESEPNPELHTLVRYADALGFDVIVTLKSRGGGKELSKTL